MYDTFWLVILEHAQDKGSKVDRLKTPLLSPRPSYTERTIDRFWPTVPGPRFVGKNYWGHKGIGVVVPD